MEQITPLLQRIDGFLQGSPVGRKIAQYPVTSLLSVLSVFFHFLCLVGDSALVTRALAVSPSATLMNGKVWTLLTSALVEENTTKFGILFAGCSYGSYVLESELGSPNLAKLLTLTTIASSFLSALTFVAVYMTTLNDEIFFSHVYGLGGILVSQIVAYAKLSKAKSETNVLSGKLFVIPLSVGFYSMLGLKFPLHDALLVVFSFFIAVTFLRSENFSWRDFSPSAQSVSVAGEFLAPTTPIAALPTPDPTKERLRAKGFKLLDKKLAELEATPEIPLDFGDRGDLTPSKV